MLFISPHYDDAAFSCAGAIAQLRRLGHAVMWATMFSAGRAHPAGFALECQTSKGIAAERDYMAIRRREDQASARALRMRKPLRMGFLEAPHRGYESAAALFAGVRESDARVLRALTRRLLWLVDHVRPVAMWVPCGAGAHVDHVLIARAAQRLARLRRVRIFSYLEVPYVLQLDGLQRAASAATAACLGNSKRWHRIALRREPAIAERAAASYPSQLGYQLRHLGSVREMVMQSRRHMAMLTGSAGLAEAVFG